MLKETLTRLNDKTDKMRELAEQRTSETLRRTRALDQTQRDDIKNHNRLTQNFEAKISSLLEDREIAA